MKNVNKKESKFNKFTLNYLTFSFNIENGKYDQHNIVKILKKKN